MLEKNIELNGKTILITGAAGFIGANLVTKLLEHYENIHIIGLDNMNSYYDVSLKEFRLNTVNKLLASVTGVFTFIQGDIADKAVVKEVFDNITLAL